MEHIKHKIFSSSTLLLGLVGLVFGGAIIYSLIKIYTLQTQVEILSQGLEGTRMELSLNTNKLAKNVTDLTNQTTGLSKTLNNTQQNIDAVKSQVGGVAQSVGVIGGAVGNLQKLAQVDPQILKKYSKVYFLNDNYLPAGLTQITPEYLYSENRSEQFMSQSWPFLKNLLDTAKRDGVTLYVKSGYRSYAEQKSLKSAYTVMYGAGTANSFSAEQGYSEHQLGTTLDFITTGLGGNLNGFDTTAAYQWLLVNGYRFGFVLSYPKGNNYYIYEPWHWRFVGVKLATYLHDNRLNFYDLDQRQIDAYLINVFD